MVIVGTAGAEYETRGMVEAYDAESGAKIWEFAPRRPASRVETHGAGMPGIRRRLGVEYARGGCEERPLGVVDRQSQSDYQGETRPGDNAYTDSILALHAQTGKLAWWYQEVPHDLWDYDASGAGDAV